MAERITSVNAVCINVRRTSFVTNPQENKFRGALEVPYFEAAVRHMQHNIADPVFFLFSDDIGWCRERLGHVQPAVIVDHSVAGRKFGQYLRLISLCRHFIIPNSSFGWWGAWLGTAPDKVVIAPRQWYRDARMDTSRLTPPEWIRM